jgi:hypothetical protein
MTPILAIALVILTVLLTFWALLDISQSKEKDNLLWFVIVLVLPAVGAIIYFQVKGNGLRKAFGKRILKSR